MELWEIQKLQFENKERAEKETRTFLQGLLRKELGGIVNVELRPSPVSLNSFNGVVEVESGLKYFFKSHAQSEEVVREYYNTKVLSDAGYDVIEPVFLSRDIGKQILVYPYLEFRTLFDLIREYELKDEVPEKLLGAQSKLDRETFEIYLASWRKSSAKENVKAPIHQLFHLRFFKRFEEFYRAKNCSLLGLEYGFEKLVKMKWFINGQEYGTLENIIKQSKRMLKPDSATYSVIGHGDAHLGNVMLDNKGKLLLFDPAFAGRHSPLLDAAKPLFHNTFAEWMYFRETDKVVSASLEVKKDKLVVEHDFKPSRIRFRLFESKLEDVVAPSMNKLKENGENVSELKKFIKCAMFACSFLTTNLLDRKRYSEKLGLLGLAISVEMGSLEADTFIGQELDEYCS